MAKKNGLGRGLEALLPDVEETLDQIDNKKNDRIVDIPISSIDPNRNQPRRLFDPEALASLADSIRQSGVISPILVAKSDDRYTIIAGERRFRAAQIAGLATIPAIVRDWDDIRRQEAALIENIQRVDLNPIEEAVGIHRLIEQCGLTQEEAAQRLGKSRPAVANSLRLLSLPDGIQEALINGKLTAGHARVLCSLDSKKQMELFEKALKDEWSVRQLEAQAALDSAPHAKSKRSDAFPPEYHELCDSLREMTGLHVHLTGTPEKGRIILDYTNQEALQRLWDLLGDQRKL